MDLTTIHLTKHTDALTVPSVTLAGRHTRWHQGYAAVPAPQRFTLATAERAAVAYGPRVLEAGVAPAALAVNLCSRADLTTPIQSLDLATSVRFLDQLNEPGSGTFVLLNDDPARALVGPDSVVRFDVSGWAAFSMLVQSTDRVTLSAAEESGETTAYTGAGHLAVFSEAVVYPPRGIGSLPFTDDRVFNWASPEFDDSLWGIPHNVVQQGAFSRYWTGIPANWPDPSAYWLWAPGTDSEWAPEGDCYFRTKFYTDVDGKIIVYVTADAQAELCIDGGQILQTVYATADPTEIRTAYVDVTKGWHTVAVHGVNDPDPERDRWHNPGGILVTAYMLRPDGTMPAGNPWLFHTEAAGWRGVFYPPGPPGMTIGRIIRQIVTEAQQRGALPGVSLAFTDQTDSDGVAWPVRADVSTKVGTDYLSFLRQLVTYSDVWLEPGSFRLWLWNADGRGDDQTVSFHGATVADDPATGNLAGLTYRGAF